MPSSNTSQLRCSHRLCPNDSETKWPRIPRWSWRKAGLRVVRAWRTKNGRQVCVLQLVLPNVSSWNLLKCYVGIGWVRVPSKIRESLVALSVARTDHRGQQIQGSSTVTRRENRQVSKVVISVSVRRLKWSGRCISAVKESTIDILII